MRGRKEVVKKERAEHNLCPKNNPECYNTLYPKLMKIYWTYKGILGKMVKGG